MCRTASDRCRSSLRTGMTTDTGGQSVSGDGRSAEAGDICTMTSVKILHAGPFRRTDPRSPPGTTGDLGERFTCCSLAGVFQAGVLQHLGDQRGDLRPLRAGERYVREQRVTLELLDDGHHAVV